MLFGSPYLRETGYGTTHSGYRTTPVGCRGGNRYVEGDLLTFGYLMLDDSLGYLYFRLFNVDDSLGFPFYRLINVRPTQPTTNNQQPTSHIAT